MTDDEMLGGRIIPPLLLFFIKIFDIILLEIKERKYSYGKREIRLE